MSLQKFAKGAFQVLVRLSVVFTKARFWLRPSFSAKDSLNLSANDLQEGEEDAG